MRDAAKQAGLQEWYLEEWDRYVGGYRTRRSDAPDATQQKSERMLDAGDYLAAHWHEAPVTLVFCFNPRAMAITDADLDRPSAVGGASVYTAVQNALLAARNEGLGCVLTTLLCFKETEVKELLGIPDTWYTAAHIPLGYPIRTGHGPIARMPIGDLSYADAWGVACL